jgi:hypothetical protein
MKAQDIPEIKVTVKTDNCVAHVMIIGFEKEKHQNIYNSLLAKLLIEKQNSA